MGHPTLAVERNDFEGELQTTLGDLLTAEQREDVARVATMLKYMYDKLLPRFRTAEETIKVGTDMTFDLVSSMSKIDDPRRLRAHYLEMREKILQHLNTDYFKGDDYLYEVYMANKALLQKGDTESDTR